MKCVSVVQNNSPSSFSMESVCVLVVPTVEVGVVPAISTVKTSSSSNNVSDVVVTVTVIVVVATVPAENTTSPSSGESA